MIQSFSLLMGSNQPMNLWE